MHALQITISATCYIFNNPFKLFFCDVKYVIKFSIIISSCFCVKWWPIPLNDKFKASIYAIIIKYKCNICIKHYLLTLLHLPGDTPRLKKLKSPASNQSPALNSPANVLERLIFWSAINLINLSIKSTFIY